MCLPLPTSTLFPYTTLFRSHFPFRPEESARVPERLADGDCRIERGCGNLISHGTQTADYRSEEHTSELQSLTNLVCRLLLEKKKNNKKNKITQEEHTIIQKH